MVQIVGESDAFLNATDTQPVAVKYISFSTWGTSEGKWFYDCQSSSSDCIYLIYVIYLVVVIYSFFLRQSNRTN